MKIEKYNPYGGAFKISDCVTTANGDVGTVIELCPALEGYSEEEMFDDPALEAAAVVRISQYGLFGRLTDNDDWLFPESYLQPLFAAHS